jgi:glutamate 5-kinase
MQQEVGDSKSSQGTGGMQSKIEAAIAKAANIETWVIWTQRRFYFECNEEYHPFTKNYKMFNRLID